MKRYALLLTAVAGLATLAASEAQAQARVEVGVLTCTVRGGSGLHHRLDQGPALPLQQAGPRRVLLRQHLQVRPRHRRHPAVDDRLGGVRPNRQASARLPQRQLWRRQCGGDGGPAVSVPMR